MSATPSFDEPAPHGTSERLFDEIRQQAALLRLQVGLLEMHAEVFDLSGCHYCARRAAAHARSLYASLADVTERAIRDQEEADREGR
jgi:hypothetical protein